MIIKYRTGFDTYDALTIVPEALPWKLTIEIYSFDEETGDTTYALRLTAGDTLTEDLALSDDFLGALPEEIIADVDKTDDALTALFNQIVEQTATDLAQAIKEGEIIFDLTSTIRDCKEQWLYDLKQPAD